MPFVAIDFYSKYMAHAGFFDGLQILQDSYFFTLGDPIRNYGWALHGDVELNSFANISSNICSVLLIPITFLCLLFSETPVSKLQWVLLSAGAFGNGIERALCRSVTDFIYFHDTGTFLDEIVANLADLYVMSGLFIYLLRYFHETFLPTKPDNTYSDEPKQKRFKYTKEETQEVIERYQNGESLEKIANLVKTSVPSVRGKLVHAGVYISSSRHNT